MYEYVGTNWIIPLVIIQVNQSQTQASPHETRIWFPLAPVASVALAAARSPPQFSSRGPVHSTCPVVARRGRRGRSKWVKTRSSISGSSTTGSLCRPLLPIRTRSTPTPARLRARRPSLSAVRASSPLLASRARAWPRPRLRPFPLRRRRFPPPPRRYLEAHCAVLVASSCVGSPMSRRLAACTVRRPSRSSVAATIAAPVDSYATSNALFLGHI